MAVTDTTIIDWKNDFAGADTNAPSNVEEIDTDLGEEVRTVKSVFRQQMEEKDWHWILGQQASLTVEPNKNNSGQTKIRSSVAAGADAYVTGQFLRLTSTANGTLYHRVISSGVVGDYVTTLTRPCMTYQGTDVLTATGDPHIWTIAGDQTAVYAAGMKVLFVDRSTDAKAQWVAEITTVVFFPFPGGTTITFDQDRGQIDPATAHYLYIPQGAPLASIGDLSEDGLDPRDLTKIESHSLSVVPWLSGVPWSQQALQETDLVTDKTVSYAETEPNTTYEVKACTFDGSRMTDMTDAEKVAQRTGPLTSSLTTSGCTVTFMRDPDTDDDKADVDIVIFRNQAT